MLLNWGTFILLCLICVKWEFLAIQQAAILFTLHESQIHRIFWAGRGPTRINSSSLVDGPHGDSTHSPGIFSTRLWPTDLISKDGNVIWQSHVRWTRYQNSILCENWYLKRDLVQSWRHRGDKINPENLQICSCGKQCTLFYFFLGLREIQQKECLHKALRMGMNSHFHLNKNCMAMLNASLNHL